MSALQERNISRFLYNPFAVYIADDRGEQPAVPSFYTEPAISLNFNKEFVTAKVYENCGGVLYTARAELASFEFRVAFTIKETTLNGIRFVEGGTINSDADEIVLDGSHDKRALWLESCYNDDSKIIRIIIPSGKSVDAVELATGEAHVMHPNNFLSLIDSNDPESFPSIYIEP